MNKRQAKKNFKKRYGFNPPKDENGRYLTKEYQAVMQIDWSKLGETLSNSVVAIVNGIINIGKQLQEALGKIEKNKPEEAIVNTAKILSERRKNGQKQCRGIPGSNSIHGAGRNSKRGSDERSADSACD